MGDGPAAGETQDYRSSLFTEWSGFITTAGALAAALGTYQLTKRLGRGDFPSSEEQIRVVLATIAFAAGVGLLIAIPVWLRTSNVALISDAVRAQRRWNLVPIVALRNKVVASSSLFGYNDIVAFEKAYEDLTREARVQYWQQDQEPLPELSAKLKLFADQRASIEEAVVTARIRSASAGAILVAIIGLMLAVGGFATATLLTNQAIRDADVADTATTQRNSLDTKILDDALSEPGARAVLPSKSAAIAVAIPADSAAEVLGLPETTAAACSKRSATALDVGSPPLDVTSERIVFVAFESTEACPASAAWIDPIWIVA